TRRHCGDRRSGAGNRSADGDHQPPDGAAVPQPDLRPLMRVSLQALRTALFYLIYMGQTVVLAIFLGTYVIIVRRRTDFAWRVATYWYRSNVVLLRWIAGIETAVDGAENIPPGPVIFASKHQSNWDIFAILPYCDDKPAFIAKRELMDIPFFGWAARM